MPLTPRCECGHEYFMHGGAGNGPVNKAGSCSGSNRKKPTDVRTSCTCREYKPNDDTTKET